MSQPTAGGTLHQGQEVSTAPATEVGGVAGAAFSSSLLVLAGAAFLSCLRFGGAISSFLFY